MDRIDALRLFIRVAETGGFSRAAAEAEVGQPVVSRAVARLEEAFGAQLLLRTTRKVSLTEAGERALAARTIVEDFDLLDADVRGLEREPVGLLRISTSLAFACAEIAPHMPDFLRVYPHVFVEFAVNDRRIDIVAEGVDLAFRFGVLGDSALTARRLGHYAQVLVAAPSLLERCGAPEHPDDLKAIPCIAFTSTSSAHSWSLRAPGKTTDVEVSGEVRATTGPLVLDLAKRGLGVTLIPEFLARSALEAGELTRVLPGWCGGDIAIQAVWASGRHLPRKARAFLEFLAPRLSATT